MSSDPESVPRALRVTHGCTISDGGRHGGNELGMLLHQVECASGQLNDASAPVLVDLLPKSSDHSPPAFLWYA